MGRLGSHDKLTLSPYHHFLSILSLSPSTNLQLSLVGNLPPKVVEEVLKNKPSFDTVMNFGCQFLLRNPRGCVVIIKVYVKGNMKKAYAEGQVKIQDCYMPAWSGRVQLHKVREPKKKVAVFMDFFIGWFL